MAGCVAADVQDHLVELEDLALDDLLLERFRVGQLVGRRRGLQDEVVDAAQGGDTDDGHDDLLLATTTFVLFFLVLVVSHRALTSPVVRVRAARWNGLVRGTIGSSVASDRDRRARIPFISAAVRPTWRA
jgi:hypothetical protein